jgi:hypothetical protein
MKHVKLFEGYTDDAMLTPDEMEKAVSDILSMDHDNVSKAVSIKKIIKPYFKSLDHMSRLSNVLDPWMNSLSDSERDEMRMAANPQEYDRSVKKAEAMNSGSLEQILQAFERGILSMSEAIQAIKSMFQ